jgi:hypothetical protein
VVPVDVEQVEVAERVAGLRDAGGDAAGIQVGLLGVEYAEYLIGDLAGPPRVHLGDAIGDRGGVGVGSRRHQRAFQMCAGATQRFPAGFELARRPELALRKMECQLQKVTTEHSVHPIWS